MESAISRELYSLLEGEIIERIMREGKVENQKNYLKSILEGTSFKITEKMAPQLHLLCQEVQRTLKFDEPIDFFIQNSPVLNCSAFYRLEEDQNHIIMINSELLERFDEDELRFVIGHEIGHLISKNSNLLRILEFIFPRPEETPLIFHNKINLWYKLSELTADRYGYIASPNLDKCISNFFKLASGLSLNKISFNPKEYLAEMERTIDFFQSEPFQMVTTHPVNPVRIRALALFSESQLYQSTLSNEKIEPDKDLDLQITELIDILMFMDRSQLDIDRRFYTASAGLLMAGADDNISKDEVDHIVNILSQFTMFPKKFLDYVYRSGNVEMTFQQATARLLRSNPAEKYPMFNFLIHTALSDHELLKCELEFLYDIGDRIFGFTKLEVAQLMGQVISTKFTPRFYQ
jgi:hypothetical protein